MPNGHGYQSGYSKLVPEYIPQNSYPLVNTMKKPSPSPYQSPYLSPYRSPEPPSYQAAVSKKIDSKPVEPNLKSWQYLR